MWIPVPENVDFPAFFSFWMLAEAAGSHLDLRSRSIKSCRIDFFIANRQTT